jgi:hypothetical protein
MNNTVPIGVITPNSPNLWNKIWEARSSMGSREIYTRIGYQEERKWICGRLDAEAMEPVLDKILEMGKEFVDAHDFSGTQKILFTLKFVNDVLYTISEFETHCCKFGVALCFDQNDFADKVQQKSDARLNELWRYFATNGGDIEAMQGKL